MSQDMLGVLRSGTAELTAMLRGPANDTMLTLLRTWLAEVQSEIRRTAYCPSSGVQAKSSAPAEGMRVACACGFFQPYRYLNIYFF